MTFIADIFPQLDHIGYVKRKLSKWMKRERAGWSPLSLTGQRTYVIHEPLGVVGHHIPVQRAP